MMGRTLLSGPSLEPITLGEAKTACRVLHDGLDSQIDPLIRAGRERCERVADVALISQQWRLDLYEWPCDRVIRGMIPPVISVDSVKYKAASDGTLTTLAADQYQFDSSAWPPVIVPAYGVSWPSVRCGPGAVQVTFTAGYGTAASNVPGEIRERIKAYVAYCLRHQEDVDNEYLDRLFLGHWSGTY